MCVNSVAVLELRNAIKLTCVWPNCGQQLHVNSDSIGHIIKTMQACKV